MKKMSAEIRKMLLDISKDSQPAFNAFYDLFYLQVYRFCFYYLQNREVCKEVVSDVFFSIWKSRVKLQAIHNIDVFLYVVAKNAALNYLRKDLPDTYIPIENLPIHKEKDDDTPENNLESSEIEELLKEIIHKLPPKSRLIFLMVRQEGMKYREIAQMLGLTESTVRVQMKIAIDKITAQIKLYYPNLTLPIFLMMLFRG
ncbi:RNA polymerase sigma-70 factor [Parabacteroides pacaensis]|uniref:RNA polymerase sigma-70 factor n=1 Tax=Parabacteroides pacaensis TaxID=2086575 RepID=UPI000D0FAFC2|nr:RNA polymerase sigma-70 factor [Parabacteroides pacaensis]